MVYLKALTLRDYYFKIFESRYHVTGGNVMSFFKSIFCLTLGIALLSLVSVSNATNIDDELYIAKGIENINLGKYSEAADILKKALQISPDNIEALYYYGLAYSKLGSYAEAEVQFKRILRLDENNENALLELGRLQHITSRCDQAKESLSRFIALTMEDEAEKYALSLIQSCSKKTEGKPYKLSLLIGEQYDTNVILESSNPITSTGKKSDTSTIFYLAGGLDLFKKQAANVRLDYAFYQSLHSSVKNFDIQYHKIAPKIESAISDTIKSTAGYSLEYTFVGGDLYCTTDTYYGKFSFRENKGFSTEAIYEYKDRRYSNSPAWSTNSDRTGYQNTIGIRQYLNIGKLEGNVYYLSDFNRARQDYNSFNGYRAGAEFDYNLSPFFLNIAGEYNENRYTSEAPGSQIKRLDRISEYTAGVTYIINKRLGVILKNTYSKNNSSLSSYDYTRNVTGLFLWGGIL